MKEDVHAIKKWSEDDLSLGLTQWIMWILEIEYVNMQVMKLVFTFHLNLFYYFTGIQCVIYSFSII